VRVLFVGINPGIRSAQLGHHFAGYSNRFWKLLFDARLVPEPIGTEQDVRLPEWGFGITNLVARATPGIDTLRPEEYVEGARVGVDPRLVTQLRRGEFSSQAHIDLHGMVQTDAKEALRAFIIDSTRKGLRSITVVHGRGLGSPGGRPILKHATVKWLSHGYLSGFVLAFTTARPADGGAGALYVLLKRERRRAPFAVLSGTKRHD